jgi:predicted  nucleic acid-binding Zn-ribbon protein
LNNDFADTKKDLNESKTTIDESNILLSKYKDQRNMVTNNKEYEALVNEMAYRENLVEELTLKISESNILLENKKELIEEKKNILEEKIASLSENQQQLDEKLSETADEENRLAEKRNKLVAKIDKQLYNLYDRIYRSKNLIAVVPADEGHCGGCFTILPSQKLSELKRRDSIVQCDTCSRILIYSFEDEGK